MQKNTIKIHCMFDHLISLFLHTLIYVTNDINMPHKVSTGIT